MTIYLIILTIVGLVLITRPQVKALEHLNKRTEICPAKVTPTTHQQYLKTRLAGKYVRRSTMLFPKSGLQVEMPFATEIAGAIILLGCVYWEFHYGDSISVTSTALGGLCWVFITKMVLTRLLEACTRPSAKLVAVAMAAYPVLFVCIYLAMYLMKFFNIFVYPFNIWSL